jgi:hypothetical protein
MRSSSTATAFHLLALGSVRDPLSCYPVRPCFPSGTGIWPALAAVSCSLQIGPDRPGTRLPAERHFASRSCLPVPRHGRPFCSTTDPPPHCRTKLAGHWHLARNGTTRRWTERAHRDHSCWPSLRAAYGRSVSSPLAAFRILLRGYASQIVTCNPNHHLCLPGHPF